MQLFLFQLELNMLLRTFILNIATNISLYYILCFVFPKRRYTKLLVFFAIFRFFVDFYLTNMYINTSTLSTSLYLSCIFILSITLYIVFAIVFCYPHVMVWVAATFLELIVSLIAMPCLMFLNLVEGRQPVTVFSAPFQFPDLLLLIIIPGCTVLITKIFGRILRKISTYHFKHTRLITIVLFSYAFIALLSRTKDVSEVVSFSFIILLVVCLLLFLFLGPTQLNLSRAHLQQAGLQAQQKLMASYLTTVQNQIANIRETQALIDTQMEKITHSNAVSNTDSFSSYLAELEQHYEAAKTSSYSDDWMLDAVVSSHAEQFKEKQIRFHCSLVGYHAGVMEEWDFVEFLTFLLDYGMQLNESVPVESRTLSITVATVKNTLVISFSSAWSGDAIVSKRTFLKNLKNYHCDIQIEKEKATLKIAFSLLGNA